MPTVSASIASRQTTDAAASHPTPIVHHRRFDGKWEVCAGWEDRLFGPDAPDWFALDRCPPARKVKAGHDRFIWSLDRAGGTLFLKESRGAGLGNRLKRWVVGDAARREWRVALAAWRRGVPVVRPVAVGTGCRGSPRTILISEGFGPAMPATQAWNCQLDNRKNDRRRAAATMIDALARLFAVSHQRGFLHADAHPNNILVRSSPAGPWEAVFVDVHGARLHRRPLTPRQSMRSFVQLDQYFHRVASRTERWRFLQTYLAHRPELALPRSGRTALRKTLTDFFAAVAAHKKKLARRRDRRLAGDGRYFTKLSLTDGWRAVVALRLARRHVFPEPGVPDRRPSEWITLLSQVLPEGADAATPADGIVTDGVRVEVDKIGGFGVRCAAAVRGSPHRRWFEQCHRRRHRDLPAGLILGYAEHRRFGLLDRTILLRAGQDAKKNATPAQEQT